VTTAKTSLNFDFTRAGAGSRAPVVIPRREVVVGAGPHARRCVAWCGLLIDSETLEIKVDYTRYSGDWAREAVTVPGKLGSGKAKPFEHLGRRVVAYLRPKCVVILYDHSINSPSTARLNVYQSFLLAAVKLHCYVAAASDAGHRGGPSPAIVHAAIVSGIKYMEGAVRHHMAVARATHHGAKGRIQKSHVKYLGLTAFVKILTRKQTRHARALRMLRRDLSAPAMRAAARRLAPVVDDRLSSVFDEIRC
jgi:telomerase reverse transcriptase